MYLDKHSRHYHISLREGSSLLFFTLKLILKLVVVAHTFIPSTQGTEAVRGQPDLQSESQDSWDYTEEPVIEKKNNKTKQNNNNKTLSLK